MTSSVNYHMNDSAHGFPPSVHTQWINENVWRRKNEEEHGDVDIDITMENITANETEASKVTSSADRCFVGLPLEVRKRIYRYLVVAMDATVLDDNPAFSAALGCRPTPPTSDHEDEPSIIGHIRGVSPFMPRHPRAIFQVNRQIRSETMAVTRGSALTWIVITINYAKYSVQLARKGFPIAFACYNDHAQIASPLASMNVHIPRATAHAESDTFAVHWSDVEHIIRALWLTVGRDQMDIFINLAGQRCLSLSVVQKQEVAILHHQITQSLGRLWGVDKVFFARSPPISEQALQFTENVTVLMTDMKVLPMTVIMAELGKFRANGKTACSHGMWSVAERHYLNAMAFANDCKRLCANEVSNFIVFVQPNFGHFIKLVLLLASNLSIVSFKLGKYHKAVEYASYATCTYTKEPYYAKSFRHRGYAHAALGRHLQAAKDFAHALELRPNDHISQQQLQALRPRLEALCPRSPDPVATIRQLVKAEIAEFQAVERAYLDTIIAEKRAQGTIVIELNSGPPIVHS